jgi:hypothetical protein
MSVYVSEDLHSRPAGVARASAPAFMHILYAGKSKTQGKRHVSFRPLLPARAPGFDFTETRYEAAIAAPIVWILKSSSEAIAMELRGQSTCQSRAAWGEDG